MSKVEEFITELMLPVPSHAEWDALSPELEEELNQEIARQLKEVIRQDFPGTKGRIEERLATFDERDRIFLGEGASGRLEIMHEGQLDFDGNSAQPYVRCTISVDYILDEE